MEKIIGVIKEFFMIFGVICSLVVIMLVAGYSFLIRVGDLCTGSMEPFLSCDCLEIYKKIDYSDTVQKDDVIVYRNLFTGQRYVHRIVGRCVRNYTLTNHLKNGTTIQTNYMQYGYEFKGDGNHRKDMGCVRKSQMEKKLVWKYCLG